VIDALLTAVEALGFVGIVTGLVLLVHTGTRRP
jgi:hypothetical protein